MYAQCTHCSSWLGVSASDLRGTQGRVRCGYCQRIFIALESLSDQLPKQELGVDISAASRAPHTGSTVQGRQARPPSATGDAPVSMSSFLNHPVDNEDGQPASPSAPSVTRCLLSKRRFVRQKEGIPEILRDNVEALAQRRRFFRRRVLPTLSNVVLCLLLAVQFIWFESEKLVLRYPQVRGFFEVFCGLVACHVPMYRDPAHIHVVSRHVRLHPEYEGVLRVTATLMNALSRTQPYPRIRFRLFNVNGHVIATRSFLPQEYLATNIDVKTGMPAQTPVQFELDLMALEEAAVSFEFQFL